MDWYTDTHNKLTARQIIASIANEYIELSHDKVRWQRDDIVKRCMNWLNANPEEVEDEQL
jgi:hypothetical protein